MIGKRALDDPRNSLVHHFVRLVVELKASYFVFENVRGLTVGAHRKFLEENEVPSRAPLRQPSRQGIDEGIRLVLAAVAEELAGSSVLKRPFSRIRSVIG